MHYYIAKARKSNPYPKGLKISAGTKKSISGSECHFNFSVESTIFSHFLSLNFLPPKANYKRTKEEDSFVVVIWHEMREPFQRYWTPVNKSPRWEWQNKNRDSSLVVPRPHKASKPRARKFNFMRGTTENRRVRWQNKVFFAAILCEERGKPGQPERQLLQQTIS